MPILNFARVAWGRRLTLAICASVALAVGGAAELHANIPAGIGLRERTWSFDIPPQAVVSALRSWSAVTGCDWAYVGDDSLGSIRSPGVTGSLTGSEALDRLLAGTGLTYVILPDGGVSISRTGSEGGSEGMV